MAQPGFWRVPGVAGAFTKLNLQLLGVEMMPSYGTRSVVLDFYHADKIVTDADLTNAARILVTSDRPEELLLAHEFATLAMGERYDLARPLFAETRDAFAAAIGQHTRYASHRSCRAVQRILNPAPAQVQTESTQRP